MHRIQYLPLFCLLLSEACTPTKKPQTPTPLDSDVIAFVDVNVIPLDEERVLPAQTVLVKGETILRVGPKDEVKAPPGATVIDGRGLYLMPGLSDMHVHTGDENDLLLFLANGVTTLRVMWGTPQHLSWRQQIAAGELLGPTLYLTGPIVDGNPPVWDGSAVVETPEEADKAISAQKAAGYDFVKVYSNLSREAYDAIIAAAKDANMPVMGHVPLRVGLSHALVSGQKTIEHLTGYLAAIQRDDSPLLSSRDPALWQKAADFIDEAKIAPVVQKTYEAKAWNCPTLVVFQKTLASPEEQKKFAAQKELRYISPLTRAAWDPSKDFRTKNMTEDDYAAVKRKIKLSGRLIKALHKGGAGILLGTDTGNAFVLPGFAVHEELQNLVDAGLSPYEALLTSTRNPALALAKEEEFGTIEEGKRADLLLLSANPLEDIKNASRLVGVMSRGRYQSKEQLDAALEELAASYATGKKDRFAGMPDLPQEGTREFTGRYEALFSGTPFGETRLILAHRDDGSRFLFAQDVVEAPATMKTSLRVELAASGANDSLWMESSSDMGTSLMEAKRAEGKVTFTLTFPGAPPQTLTSDAPEDVLLGSVVPVAVYTLLGESLGSLKVGERATRSVLGFALGGSGLETTTIQAERLPDERRESAKGEILAKVYALTLSASFGSTSGVLVLDEESRPVEVKTTLQMGEISYRRVEK